MLAGLFILAFYFGVCKNRGDLIKLNMKKPYLHPGVNYTALVSSGRLKAPGVDFTDAEKKEIAKGKDFKEVQADFRDAQDLARIRERAAAGKEAKAKAENKTDVVKGEPETIVTGFAAMKRGQLFSECENRNIEVAMNTPNKKLMEILNTYDSPGQVAAREAAAAAATVDEDKATPTTKGDAPTGDVKTKEVDTESTRKVESPEEAAKKTEETAVEPNTKTDE